MRLRDFSILALWAAMLCACSDDDFSTSPSDPPTPSADTISLGMLLTGNSSPTYQFKLYNRCGNDLRLTSIALRGASDNGFRMNVDGMNGTSFTNSDLLRIASGDSMFIFVEATFPSDGTSATKLHRLEMSDDGQKALCPDCDSEFGAIFWGSPAPTAGPANQNNYVLRQYKATQVGDKLVVRN